MKFLFSLLFTLLFITANAASQYYFRHYDNENGLSNNTLLCSLQDSRGFLWLGTKDGLNRFDGYQFKVFFHNPNNQNSVNNNFIMSLAEDKDSCIWIGTLKGICFYNPHTDKFEKIQNEKYSNSDAVTDVKVDLKNNIWFTNSQGIYRYDKITKALNHYPYYNYFIPFNICITSSENIWFSATNGKIYKYDPRNDNFIQQDILTEQELASSVSIRNITDIGADGLLITTNNSGARKFDTNTGRLYTLFTRDSEGKEIHINTVLKQSDNEIWFGTETGIHIYNFNRGFLRNIVKSNKNNYSISNNAIRTFTKDYEGGIWVGTFYGGLNYLPQETTPFEKYYPTNEPGSILGNVIRAITADKNGNLWIGTEDAGLSKLNPRTGNFQNFLTKPGSEVTSANIHEILADDNKIWVASYDNGIYILDINTNKVIKRFRFENTKEGLRTNAIITFLKTRNGELYIGTRNGLYKYDKTQDKISYLSDVAAQSFIHDLYEDYEGTIWIGTYGNGVFSYDRAKNTCIHLYYSPDDSLSLGSDHITSIFEDAKNQLWFTSEGNGFCRYIKETGTFERFTIKNGLHCGIFCSIVEDGTGLMWIASSNGLMTFNPETMDLHVYKKENGIVDNHFSYNAAYMDNNGKIYFGTVNGFIAFNPSEFKNSTYNPPIFITDFQIPGVNWDSLRSERGLEKSIIETREIKLKHFESSFNIGFVSPAFTSPLLTKYRYKLEGLDTDWIYLNSNRQVYFTNVPPGNYKFRVSAIDSNSEWNASEAVLSIKIKPPYWATNFAYALYFILFLSVIYIIFKIYLLKKKAEHEQKLGMLVAQKEKEILNAKISFFTNITHEVRTPLTLIKAPLDKILSGNEYPKHLTDNLSVMKRNTDRLLELTNQLLDFRKTEKERIRLNFKKINICDLIEDIYNRFIPAAEEKNIDFVFSKPESKIYINLDKETITKIISNLFTNAIKFADNRIKVFIEPSNPERNLLCVRVNSNGNIIPEQYREKVFEPFFQISLENKTNINKGTGLGLPLARSLAELHHGRLFIDNNISELNSFVLELPMELNSFESYVQTQETREKTIVPEEIQQEQTKISPTYQKPVILIVEDEKELCKFISDELSEKYDTLTAINGAEAVKILQEYTVSLVVSDVVMPVMDGYELCSFIKNNLDYSHIPIILLTATINLNARIEGLESGADAYIEKPFTTELLLAQISNLFMNRELACNNFINTPLTHYKTVAVNKMDEDFMKRLHSIIMKHLSESDLNVEMVAQLMGMSVSTLYRKVKAITELNTNEYIRLYRLKKAAEMLTNNEYRINEVSYLVGFSSPSYFATSFQRQFGMSPSEFLKQQKNKLHSY